LELRRIFEEAKPGENPVYIVKRPGLSRGQGVHLVNSVADVDAMLNQSHPCAPLQKKKPIAQQYIKNVYLLEGHKVTFRVYATITSLDPLRIYVFPDGLGRICAHKYTLEPEFMRDIFTHVDSYDINHVREEEFNSELETAASSLKHEGLRSSITQVVASLEQEGRDGKKVWEEMKRVVLMSIIAAEPEMNKEFQDYIIGNRTRRLSPWEMVGYDLLVDTDLKVWLLEINNSPSMSPHTELENSIKRTLLHDLFDLVDISNVDLLQMEDKVEKKWQTFQRIRDDPEIAWNGFDPKLIKTKEDMWAIVETEIENNRKGHFDRLFPIAGGDYLLKFLDNRRNDLIVKWLNSNLSISVFDSIVEDHTMDPIVNQQL